MDRTSNEKGQEEKVRLSRVAPELDRLGDDASAYGTCHNLLPRSVNCTRTSCLQRVAVELFVPQKS